MFVQARLGWFVSVVPPSPFVQGEGCFSAQAGTHSLIQDWVPACAAPLTPLSIINISVINRK